MNKAGKKLKLLPDKAEIERTRAVTCIGKNMIAVFGFIDCRRQFAIGLEIDYLPFGIGVLAEQLFYDSVVFRS